MGGAWRTISVALHADSGSYVANIGKASASTTAFGKQTDAMAQKVNGATKSTGNSWLSLGKVLKAVSLVGIVAIGSFIAASVTAATAFEHRMAAVQAVSGATGSQLDQLRGKALQLGADTSFSAGQAASAIEELVKAGVSVGGVLDGAADATVALAAAGEIDLPQAAAIAANAMNQFGLAAKDLPHIADLIAGSANASAIDVADFGLSMTQAGAVANLVGLSFNDTATAITAMGNAGIKGSDAGTSLKTFLTNLTPLSVRASNEMRTLGIITEDGANQFFDAAGNVKSLADISDVLATSLQGMSREQKLAALNVLFGSDAIRAAAVISDEGKKGFDDLAGSISKISAADVAAQRMNSLSGSIEQFKGSVETLLIQAGGTFTKAIRPIVDGATELVNGFAATPGDYFGPIIDGARRLRPAWDNLVDTGQHIGTILGDIYDQAGPAARLLGQLGAGAIIGGLNLAADALELMAGYLADHPGLIKAATVAFGAYASVVIGANLASIIAGIYSKWLLFTQAAGATTLLTAIRTIVIGFATMGTDATVGFSMVKGGLASLTKSISGTTLGIAGIGAAAIVMAQGVSKAHDQAKAAIDDLKPKDFDARSTDAVIKYQKALGKAWVDAEKSKDATNDFVAVVKGGAELLTPMENSIIDNAIAAGDMEKAYDAAADAAQRLLRSYGKAGAELGMTGDQVEAWVMKLDIPADVVNKPKTLAKIIGEASTAAQNGTPVTDKLATSYAELADETANSTDKLKAWKDAQDAIIGVKLDVFGANTQFAASLATVSDGLQKANFAGLSWQETIDKNTEYGRTNRDSLAAAAQSALDLAEAYGQTNGIEGANLSLAANREELIKAGIAAGASRKEMELYLDQLGLTPENVKTLLELNGTEEAATKLETLKELLAGADGATATVLVRAIYDERLKAILPYLSSDFGKALSENGWIGMAFGSGGGKKPPGRAAGGPVHAGFLYQVNEHKSTLGRGEYFTPAVDGHISPQAPRIAPRSAQPQMAMAGGGHSERGVIHGDVIFEASTDQRETMWRLEKALRG